MIFSITLDGHYLEESVDLKCNPGTPEAEQEYKKWAEGIVEKMYGKDSGVNLILSNIETKISEN